MAAKQFHATTQDATSLRNERLIAITSDDKSSAFIIQLATSSNPQDKDQNPYITYSLNVYYVAEHEAVVEAKPLGQGQYGTIH